uniref:Uncharacterized protein n=1 Tax=Arundo donax TaxID=35708 RepID=A0A0A9U221_ARUDO
MIHVKNLNRFRNIIAYSPSIDLCKFFKLHSDHEMFSSYSSSLYSTHDI